MRLSVFAIGLLLALSVAAGAEIGLVLKAADVPVEIDTVKFLSPEQRTFVTRGFAVGPGQLDTFSFGDVTPPAKALFSWLLDSQRQPPHQINEIQLDVWYDFPGWFDAPPRVMFVRLSSGVAENGAVAPRMISAAPNPFTTRVTISGCGPARLLVCDRSGRVVRSLAGEGVVTWDGRDESGRRVQAGVYFVRTGTGGAVLPLVLSR